MEFRFFSDEVITVINWAYTISECVESPYY